MSAFTLTEQAPSAQAAAFAADYCPGYVALAQRVQMQEQLQHFLQFSNLAFVLYGAPGMGKTTWMESFTAQLSHEWHCCFIYAKDIDTPSKLVTRLSRVFSIKLPQDAQNEQAFDELVEHLAGSDASQVLRIIVVDDIEQWSQSMRDCLARLLQASKSLRVLVSTCDTGFSMQSLGYKESAWHEFVLEPLNEKEAQAFIHYYLTAASLEAELFSAAQQRSLFKLSQGNPGQLKRHAELMLARRQQQLFNRLSGLRMPYLHSVAIAVIVIVIIASSLYHQRATDLGQDTELASPLPVQRIEPMQSIAEPSLETGVATQIDAGESDALAAAVQEDKPAVTHDVPAGIPSLLSEPAASLKRAQTDTEQMASTEKSLQTAVVQSPAGTVEQRAKPKAVPDQPDAQSQWWHQSRDSQFTVQILAVGSQRSAEQFVQRAQADCPVLVLKTQRLGQDWFSVICGVYDSWAAAAAAIKQMPAQWQSNKPWVRSVGSLRQLQAVPI